MTDEIAAEAAHEPAEHAHEEVLAPMSAVDRLRKFEDEVIGARAKEAGKELVRINGRIERGSGSPYADDKIVTPELRRQHQALEALIAAEEKLAVAHAALMQADSEHEQAEQAVADAERQADAPSDK